MNEEWKDVVGYEDYYEVSSLGRVRSKERTIECVVKGEIVYRALGSVVLKTTARVSRGGKKVYRRVALSTDGKYTYKCVHHLVLEAFVGPKPDGHVARHLDDDTSNNTPSNLVWGTPHENRMDILKNGTQNHFKLDEDAVRCIKARLSSGERVSKLAEDFGTSLWNIYAIRDGKRWGWVTL